MFGFQLAVALIDDLCINSIRLIIVGHSSKVVIDFTYRIGVMSRLGVCDLVKCHVTAGIIAACSNDLAILKKFKCEFALLQISACQLLIDLDLIGYAGWQFSNTVSIGKCELRTFFWIACRCQLAVSVIFQSDLESLCLISIVGHTCCGAGFCHLVFEGLRSGSICCRVHILQQIKAKCDIAKINVSGCIVRHCSVLWYRSTLRHSFQSECELACDIVRCQAFRIIQNLATLDVHRDRFSGGVCVDKFKLILILRILCLCLQRAVSVVGHDYVEFEECIRVGYASQIPLRFGDSVTEGVNCFPIVIGGFDCITSLNSFAQNHTITRRIGRSPVAEGIEWDHSVSVICLRLQNSSVTCSRASCQLKGKLSSFQVSTVQSLIGTDGCFRSAGHIRRAIVTIDERDGNSLLSKGRFCCTYSLIENFCSSLRIGKDNSCCQCSITCVVSGYLQLILVLIIGISCCISLCFCKGVAVGFSDV